MYRFRRRSIVSFWFVPQEQFKELNMWSANSFLQTVDFKVFLGWWWCVVGCRVRIYRIRVHSARQLESFNTVAFSQARGQTQYSIQWLEHWPRSFNMNDAVNSLLTEHFSYTPLVSWEPGIWFRTSINRRNRLVPDRRHHQLHKQFDLPSHLQSRNRPTEYPSWKTRIRPRQ